MPVSQEGNWSLARGSRIYKVSFPAANIAEAPVEAQGGKLPSPEGYCCYCLWDTITPIIGQHRDISSLGLPEEAHPKMGIYVQIDYLLGRCSQETLVKKCGRETRKEKGANKSALTN